MARYIKANPKVVAYLNLSRIRNKVKDGNYLLWQSDMLSFGPLTQLSQILTQIGAIALLPYEARQEQDGTITRTLPQATDERFIVETYTPSYEPSYSDDENLGEITDGTSESTEADSSEASSDDESEETNEEATNEDSDKVDGGETNDETQEEQTINEDI